MNSNNYTSSVVEITKINSCPSLRAIVPGTGKSLLLNALIGRLNTRIITRTGGANQFHLQNLLGESYGLFEEPRISQIKVDDFTLLFEGAEFEINVKLQRPEMLHRLPIFVFTNKEIDGYLDPTEMPSIQGPKHSSSSSLQKTSQTNKKPQMSSEATPERILEEL
ncbi:uncharacterized protein LOC122264529 [Penaeus japonicus]|uniref:uncharacterized protein LOC122264529 n=1 Tax=Penaeus japonicus TaxID=27405 RepID=UPI001C70E846|nr:uncharacterized protein LOC122264529 [Penaeus japonicus]